MLSEENLWLLYKQSVVSRARGSSGRAMYGILGAGGRGRGRRRGEGGGGTDLTSPARQMSVISWKSAKMENSFIFSVKIFSLGLSSGVSQAGDLPGDPRGVSGGVLPSPLLQSGQMSLTRDSGLSVNHREIVTIFNIFRAINTVRMSKFSSLFLKCHFYLENLNFK